MEMKYPGGGIVNTEDTETLTASDSNSEHKKNSDSNADAKTEMEAAKKRNRLFLKSRLTRLKSTCL